MHRPGRLALLTLAALLAVWPLCAEVTTGALAGTVRHGGEALPGVTITVVSTALQGMRSAISYVNGDYNVPALPPGEYTVTFELDGMKQESRRATIGLARTERIDVAMIVAPVAEEVTVEAAPPTVLETTEVQSNYTASQVEALPIGRSIQAVATFAPGTVLVKSIGGVWPDSISISGGELYDNLYLVNGAVTGENLHGEMENLFIEDAVQETSVIVGAISAEFGRFGGGVVSSITKSGGNELSGTFRDSLTNPAWTSSSAMEEERPESSLDQTLEATVGGRLVRDRLWFFLAGRNAETSAQEFFANSTIPRPVSAKADDRFEAKLTAQVAKGHSLWISYLNYEVEQTNVCIAPPCAEASTLDSSQAIPRTATALRYNAILSNDLFVEAGYSSRTYRWESYGGDHRTTDFDEPRDIALGSWGLDALTYGFWGAPAGCSTCTDERRDNDYAVVKGTWFVATKNAGTHNVVAGYETFAEKQLSNYYQSGSNFAIFSLDAPAREPDGTLRPVVGPGSMIMYYPIDVISQGSNLTTDSLFLNDKWDLAARWSFNIGLRYDRNDSVDSAGQQVSTDSNVSPRLGVIHDLQGDGRFRINASYSKYVTKIWEVAGRVDGGGWPGAIYYGYDGPTVGGLGSGLGSFDVLEEVFRWFLAQGGTNANDLILFADLGPVNNHVEDLKSPNVIEWTLGFGAQLGVGGFFRADYIDRDWKDFYDKRTEIGDVVENPLFPGTYLDMYTFANTNDVERRYRGLSFQGSYRLIDGATVGGNYTWSELRGNYKVADFYSSPSSYPEYTSYEQFSPRGPLLTDQTHKARLWASYNRPLGHFGFVNLSLLESYESGAPFQAVGSIDPSPYVTNPGYAMPPTLQNYYFTDRGAYRWEAMTSTDLAINYELPVRTARVFAQADILNIFNEQAQIDGGTGVAVLTPFDPFTETPKECPQGQADCTGYHWQKAPNFGEATGPGDYQQPRTYRFSVGLRF